MNLTTGLHLRTAGIIIIMSSASEALQEAAKGNLASGTKLSNALPKALPALKRFVDEEKYEDADEELKKWKRHTERLQEQIDNQLSHCRSLRENKQQRACN